MIDKDLVLAIARKAFDAGGDPTEPKFDLWWAKQIEIAGLWMDFCPKVEPSAEAGGGLTNVATD